MEASMLTPVTTFPGFKTAADFGEGELENLDSHTYNAWMLTTAQKLRPSSDHEEPMLTPFAQPSTSGQLSKWLNSTDAKVAAGMFNNQLSQPMEGGSPGTPLGGHVSSCNQPMVSRLSSSLRPAAGCVQLFQHACLPPL
jgi:hypothetical protein